ncbi:hypothetical protein [Deinococcus sp.]|uniref:hypothetical protein n=1 Tax=Deinococcus sp. TaxID=47478 RepID=UPI0025B94617|nr:hypothetical protein [Deinococcus sp.]
MTGSVPLQRRAQTTPTTPDAQPAPAARPAASGSSLLARPAALALRAVHTAPTLKLGLQSLPEVRRVQLGLNVNMDLQAVVVTLAIKVGYGALDAQYRALTKRPLVQDFRAEVTALDASREAMRLTGVDHAGVIGAMLDVHTDSRYMVGLEVVDRGARTDNVMSNAGMGTTRRLGQNLVDLPRPVADALQVARRGLPWNVREYEVERFSVISDPKVIEELRQELADARAKGQTQQLLTTYRQRTGRSLYTQLGELVRDAGQRKILLDLLPPPISEAQLTYDAFLENIAIGMGYENVTGDALEGKEAFEDERRHGQPAALLAYFGYSAGNAIHGKWGLDFRVFTPIPGRAKYKDVIVAWRGTEGLTIDLKNNKAGGIDTKIGDFAPGSIGYYQIQQNEEVISAQLTKARAAGPILMVGHSLGGGLAQLAATRYPQYTRAVVTFQGANIDEKDVARLEAYNKNNPQLAITARHYRADGDVVPTAGDRGLPGQIHYFDPQWKRHGTDAPFAGGLAELATSGHNIPLLNTYLQGLKTSNPELNLLKTAGIRDENQFAPGQARKDARVVYGGSYNSAQDPRMVLEGGRDNLLGLQRYLTYVSQKYPNLKDLKVIGGFADMVVTGGSYTDVIMDGLPENTLLDHLTTLALKSESYAAFVKGALKLMGLTDGTYGPVTLNVTQNDLDMAKDLNLKLPDKVQIPTTVIREVVTVRQIETREFGRLRELWTALR